MICPPGCYGHTLTPPIVCAPKDDNPTSKTRKRACSMWMFGGNLGKTQISGELWELHFPNFVGAYHSLSHSKKLFLLFYMC
jgi:hypothetical protein